MARKTERERHFVLQFKGHSVVLPGDAGPVLTGIVKAILHSGANTPRTPKDLTDTMLAHGYAHLGGLTPHATVSSRISTHFKKCNETGMEPLLGRVASASNTRKIKYYVLQLPFEVVEDFTVVLQPHEQAKLPKRDTTPPRPSSALFAANRDSNAGSSSNSNGGPKRKRKVPAAASAEGSKRPSSTHATTSSSASTTSIVVKKTPASAYFDSDSEDPDTDFVAVDTDIELDIDSTRGVHIELQLNHPGTRRSNSFDSRSTQSIWPQGSITGDSHEPDFHVHMDNELSDDGNSDGGSSLETASQSMPPQNPEQTFHFSPVFQSHIFIRPNATTLPPLSTLQNQGSLSQLSPTLFSASPPVDIQNQQHNFPHSARVFIPSPILLPSPRVFGVASPQLSSAHPLSNLRPLDLGPGLYSGHGVQMAPLSSRTLGPLPGSKAPGNSAPVEHPESVSVEDLDEIFMDYDNKRKHFQHQHEHAGPSKRRRSSVSKHVRHQPQHHHKLRTHHESRQPQSNSKFLGLNDVLPPLSMHQLQCERPPSAPQPRRPSISGLIKRPSPLLRPQPHITCELSDVHINVPLSESQTFAASSSKNNTPAAGQIVTVTRFRTGPLISMPLHNILVRSDDEKTMQSPTNRVHQNLTDFIRMGDLMRFYSAPHLFDRTITDMDPSFVALWARFCKYLLQMSLAPRGTAHRPMSPGCEEVDAAAVLVGLASPVLVGLPDSGAVVADGGDSFAVKVEGDVAEGARLFKSPLVIAVVKASAGSSRASTRPIISHECNGIWIPLEVAQYLTEMLDVPSRIKDIFTFQPIPASSAGNLQGVRVRSYSTSSYSSLASSRTKRKNTPDAASETAYLKFDDSDNEEEIDVGKEMLAPPLLSLAASPSSNDLPTAILESTPATNIDPSTLTLIPASNIAEALMWMTTIDGVFVYITWITSASTAASGSDDNQVGTPILRRVDNGLVNASQLLHAGGIHDEQEKSVVLSLERVRKRFRREDSALRGTWIPLARARELARTVSLDARLATFLSDEAGSTYFGVVATGAAGGGPSGVASPMRRKKVAASLVVGPDGVMRVKGVVDTGVPGVVGGGSGSRKRVHRFAVQAAKARASGSSLYSNVNDISSYASVLSLSPQKTIYPPGSLAERDHQRALEALAANSDAFVGAVSGEVSNGPVGTTTQSSSDASQKVTDATTTLSSVKFEPDPESSINPAAVVVDTSTLNHAATIATTENSLRIATTALANILAQSAKSNRGLAPPAIASTLAAFAVGAKKINESVRNGSQPVAPSPADILTAFAKSMKQQTGGPASNGNTPTTTVPDGLFPPVSLLTGPSATTAATDILKELDASIESTSITSSATNTPPNTVLESLPVSSPSVAVRKVEATTTQNQDVKPSLLPDTDSSRNQLQSTLTPDFQMLAPNSSILTEKSRNNIDDDFDTWSNYEEEISYARPSTGGKSRPVSSFTKPTVKGGITSRSANSSGRANLVATEETFDEEIEALFDSEDESLDEAATNPDLQRGGGKVALVSGGGKAWAAGGRSMAGGKASGVLKEMLEREKSKVADDSATSDSDDDDTKVTLAHVLGGKGRMVPPPLAPPILKRPQSASNRKKGTPPSKTKNLPGTAPVRKSNVNIIPIKKGAAPKAAAPVWQPPPILPPPTFVEATDEDEDVDILN